MWCAFLLHMSNKRKCTNAQLLLHGPSLGVHNAFMYIVYTVHKIRTSPLAGADIPFALFGQGCLFFLLLIVCHLNSVLRDIARYVHSG